MKFSPGRLTAINETAEACCDGAPETREIFVQWSGRIVREPRTGMSHFSGVADHQLFSHRFIWFGFTEAPEADRD